MNNRAKALWVFATHNNKMFPNKAVLAADLETTDLLFVLDNGYFLVQGKQLSKVTLVNTNAQIGIAALYTFSTQILDQNYTPSTDLSEFSQIIDESGYPLESSRQALRHKLSEKTPYRKIEMFTEWNLRRSGKTELTIHNVLTQDDDNFYGQKLRLIKQKGDGAKLVQGEISLSLWLQGVGNGDTQTLEKAISFCGRGQIMHHPAIKIKRASSHNLTNQINAAKISAYLSVPSIANQLPRGHSDSDIFMPDPNIIFETKEDPIFLLPPQPCFDTTHTNLLHEEPKKSSLYTQPLPKIVPVAEDKLEEAKEFNTPPQLTVPNNTEFNSGNATLRDGNQIAGSVIKISIFSHPETFTRKLSDIQLQLDTESIVSDVIEGIIDKAVKSSGPRNHG